MDALTLFIWPTARAHIDDYFESIANQDYGKDKITLFVGANALDEHCRTSLRRFLDSHGCYYRKVIIETREDCRARSIEYSIETKTHYFWSDQNVILHPHTLKRLYTIRLEVIAPMLVYDGTYSNFHADVDHNGYFRHSDVYSQIAKRQIKGIFNVPVVNGCYLIDRDCLKYVAYDDGSGRHDYVVFSDTLRRNRVPQYIDNTFNYGIMSSYGDKTEEEINDVDAANNKSFFLSINSGALLDRNTRDKRGIICNMDWLSWYIILEHYHLIRLLGAEYHFDIINCQRLDFSSAQLIADLNNYSVLVIAYQGYVEVPLDRISSYKMFKIDDLVSYNPEYDKLVDFYIKNSDMVISPYAYALSQHYNHDNVVWVPYSSAIEGSKACSRIEFNPDPIPKVLMSGSVASDRPFRQYVARLNNEMIEVLQHPGYGQSYDNNGQHYGRGNYFVVINKYLCCFTDAHQYRYVHLKNFEIASVGALLLTDRLIEPEMNELGFIDYETCVFADQETFLEKVEWILREENRAAVDRIRLAGMKLVTERHLTKHRALQIDELIRKRTMKI
jgi:Glycosyl transferases group 1